MKFLENDSFKTIQPFNLYVVPRPLTLPAIFPAPLPHLHPQRVHSRHQQEEPLLTTLSAALTLGWGKDESGSWPLLPPFLLLTYGLLQLQLAGCAHFLQPLVDN